MTNSSRENVNVLVLAKGFPPTPGGVERYSEHVARALAANGYHVRVLTQIPGPAGVFQRRYSEGAITVENLGPGNQLVVAARMFARLLRLRNTSKWALTHATTWRPAVAWLAARFVSPLTISAHGREVLHVPSWLKPIMRTCLRRASLVLCVSGVAKNAVAEQFNQFPPAPNLTVVYNGLSIAEADTSHATLERNGKGGSLKLLTVCRLVERKNVQGSLRALETAYEKGLRFHFDVVGSGPLIDDLRQQVAETAIQSMITFHGRVSDTTLSTLYGSADIFLHPQIATDGGKDVEGFGLVIADAMAHGVAPVVGADGGPAEFVIDKETGMIVNGNSDLDIAQALLVLQSDPVRQRIGSKARDWARKNLSWQTHIEPLVTIAAEAESR